MILPTRPATVIALLQVEDVTTLGAVTARLMVQNPAMRAQAIAILGAKMHIVTQNAPAMHHIVVMGLSTEANLAREVHNNIAHTPIRIVAAQRINIALAQVVLGEVGVVVTLPLTIMELILEIVRNLFL